LIDIGTIQGQDKQKTALESWWEILKTVAKLATQKQIVDDTNKESEIFFELPDQPGGDAEHFYVFLYDEDDNQKTKSFQKNKKKTLYQED
jgi:hypothetical protein